MQATKCLFRLTVKSSTMLLVYKVYTHGRPPFTLPATLPVTRIFSHCPTRTLPEVKKPYPSQPGQHQFLFCAKFRKVLEKSVTGFDR